MEEIGQHYGVSRERVRQILNAFAPLKPGQTRNRSGVERKSRR